MRILFSLLISAAIFFGGCTPAESTPRGENALDIPGPAISTTEERAVQSADEEGMERSRGIVDIRLSAENPSTTFWNDPATQRNPWGTITLVEVREDQTVVMKMGEDVLQAKRGEVFPGTGIMVVDADAVAKTVWFRSKRVHTVIRTRPHE